MIRSILSRGLAGLLALALWLAAAPAAFAAIGTPTDLGNQIQSTSVTSYFLATAAAASSGLIVVAVAFDGAPTGVGVTDDAGNTYTAASTVCTYNSTFTVRLFYAQVTSSLASGAHITISWTNVRKSAAAAIVVTGLDATAPLDVQGACTSGTNTSGAPISPTISTGTLAQANELVLGVSSINSTISAYAANSPFTTLSGTTTAAANIDWGYDITSSTASVTSAQQWSGARAYGANVWSFKQAGGTPPASRHNLPTTGAGMAANDRGPLRASFRPGGGSFGGAGATGDFRAVNDNAEDAPMLSAGGVR